MSAWLTRLRALRDDPRTKRVRTVTGHVRKVALAGVLLAAVALFASKVSPHYPIDKWLFWIYARLWLWSLGFALACLSVGHLVVGWLFPRGLALRPRLMLSAASGVLVFFLGTFVAGLLHAYGPAFAVGYPLALVAAGAVPLWRRLRRVVPRLRAARRRAPRAPWWAWPIGAFGLFCLGAVYFMILTPRNVAFDSHFYHLGLAQQYAAEGAILPSAEGWLSAAIPQLASVLYTWTLLVPGMPMVERVLLAGHLEFVLFLFTLASMPVLVRWLVPGARTGLAWVALFLFPGIFLYDSNLSTAADHITALWGIPIYYFFVRAWRALEPRHCIAFAAMVSGALLTKYQGAQLALLPVLGIVLRALYLGGRTGLARLRAKPGEARRPLDLRFLTGPAAALLAGLVLTAPHWLKNWVWYGDPLYPYLHRVFKVHPWASDAAATFDDYFNGQQVGDWRPKGTLGARLKETLLALYEFSFKPNDWPKFHGKVPIFGSLFTLGVFALPLLKRTARTWGLVAAAHLAVFQWYWTMHQDRYLQVSLPWMACVVAAVLVLVWRSGWLARGAVSLLVGLQIVWGGDVYFFGTHAMAGGSPVRIVSDLLGQGYKKKYEGRLELSTEFSRVAALLPPGARVLNHEENRRLGMWRSVVSDFVPWQYGLRWGELDSPRAMHDRLVELGVTHLLYRASTSRGFDNLAGDLRFFEYVTNWAEAPRSTGSRLLAEVAAEPPEGPFVNRVAYLGCGALYERGLHDLNALTVFDKWQKGTPKLPADVPAPGDEAGLEALLAEADFVVVGFGCKPALPAGALAGFTQAATRNKEQLWIRQRPGRAGAAPAPASRPATPGASAPDDVDELDAP
ncbi:MAG: hypothetical protein IT373_20765 [Polyangiaceae bacterium]|nr:hypothetical protein [Polyangiaceae bacterium]